MKRKQRRGRKTGKVRLAQAPVDYSDELAEKICQLISSGMSLRSVCKMDGMPDKSTVLGWLASRPAFAAQYTRAREAQMDGYAEEIVEISDDVKTKNPTDVAKARLQVDARKWVMARLKPKKYGDAIAVTGGDGKPLIPDTAALAVITDPQEAAKVYQKLIEGKQEE